MNPRKLLKGGALVLSLGLLLTGCEDKVIQEITYTANVPIYKSYDELISEIDFTTDVQPLEEPGKIYYFKNYLFIGERDKGVHIIDNSNPANPLKIGFLNIPGNHDIAIKGDYMYADCHTELVVLSLKSISNISVVNRVSNVFEYTIPEYDYSYPLAGIDQSKGMVIGYEVKEITETREYYDQHKDMYYDIWMPNQDFGMEANTATFGGGFADAGGSRNVSGSATGIGGSYAKFMIVDESLYVISRNDQVTFFDLTDPVEITDAGTFNPGWNLETMFYYENNLFIASDNGMFIYDIEDRTNPEYVSDFRHADACDPVVVDGDYAYVTLRDGARCPGWQNQLDVVDISNIRDPWLVQSFQMENPHGLAIDGQENVLFLCDGAHGLKVFDATDETQVGNNLLQHITGLETYDVITVNDILFMIGNDGLYQYDYSDPSSLNQLSVIEIGS